MGAITYSEDTPWGLGESATFYNTPGAVNEFLSWTGGLEEGNRGFPATRESVTGFEIDGTEVVMANLRRYLQEVPELVQDTLADFAEKILVESRKEVPWKSTHLLQTGTIEPAEDNSRALVIGYNTPYAARQHEDMTFYHPKPGTKAKYLEDPAMRIAPTVAPGVVERLNYYFSAGVPSMTGMMASKRASLGNMGGRFV